MAAAGRSRTTGGHPPSPSEASAPPHSGRPSLGSGHASSAPTTRTPRSWCAPTDTSPGAAPARRTCRLSLPSYGAYLRHRDAHRCGPDDPSARQPVRAPAHGNIRVLRHWAVVTASASSFPAGRRGRPPDPRRHQDAGRGLDRRDRPGETEGYAVSEIRDFIGSGPAASGSTACRCAATSGAFLRQRLLRTARV